MWRVQFVVCQLGRRERLRPFLGAGQRLHLLHDSLSSLLAGLVFASKGAVNGVAAAHFGGGAYHFRLALLAPGWWTDDVDQSLWGGVVRA